MDHAEATETEGHAPQNEIAEHSFLRGNNTEPTAELIAGDPVDINDPASMDTGSAGVDEGNLDLWGDSELASGAAVEPSDTTTSLMSTLAAATTGLAGHGPVSVNRASETTDQPAFGASVATQREPGPSSLSNDRTPVDPAGEHTVGSRDTRTTDVSQPCNPFTPQSQPSSNPMESFSSDQSSFDQGQAMSLDEDDTHSEKDSSVDARSLDAHQSEPNVPPPQDRYKAGQANERAPLEDAYGPFVHPTDTCLADARERLHAALEQTRLLRSSFSEQAYERYRCVMKPVPESLNEIVGRIHSDPNQAGAILREQADAIKVEKDVEKKQAQEAGVGLEELAYFGEGLHLVLLPEDEVDENELDSAQFPHRGPTDPKTGDRREEISAAAAATTEQVFDRIRRIRAIRLGADIVPGASIPAAVTQMKRNLGEEQESLPELFPPGFVTAPVSSTSAPSTDSNAAERTSKLSLRHLLTLSPNAEGSRPDGNFTAVQSALIARGVGTNEMKRDLRINPLHQRIFQPSYFSPTTSYKLLPPLLGPHQLYRLHAVDVQKEGPEVKTGARDSIKSVVEEICSSVSKSNSSIKEDRTKNDDSIEIAMGKEHSAPEIGLLQRMHSTMIENQGDKDISAVTSDSRSFLVAKTTDPSIASTFSDSDTSELDPLLAFSVMSAIGLVRRMEGNDTYVEQKSHLDQNSEDSYAQTLGLGSLTRLESVSKFFHTNPATSNERKRCYTSTRVAMNDAKKLKMNSGNADSRDSNEVLYQIRGGGRHDEVNAVESKARPNETGDMKKQKKNGVTQMNSGTDVPAPDSSLAGYAGFDPLYTAMSQVPLGDKQSQSVIAAAASRQLLQRQLGVHPDPYHTAALAHQLALPPIGSHLRSLHESDLSEFYLRNGLAGNTDWSALRAATPTAGADVLSHHPHLRSSLGLLPGQMNLGLTDQEAARTLLLRDRHNAAAARAQEAVTAARYQAALSSINPQNPFGFVTSSLSQHPSNETQSISSLPAFHAKQQKGSTSKKPQRQRSSSLSDNSFRNDVSKGANGIDAEALNQSSYVKRPTSAPPSPPCVEAKSTTPNGGSTADAPSKRIVSEDKASISDRAFNVPPPPKGLSQEIADLIAEAKFHEAHSLSRKNSDESKALLVEFLLTFGAAVPIRKEFIAELLVKKLSSPNYLSRLHRFVGSSSLASSSRDIIISVVSIWLWVEHQDCFKQSIDEGEIEVDPSYNWLINLAMEESLTALAKLFDSHAFGKSDGPTKQTPNEQIAAIASQSLMKKVFVDQRADATLPILDDLLKLLDSLRTDALRVKTQERVLLATLTSRCGNMSEAFSNAYVSSIVRAGIALGHENVCEIGQNEECRASTMLPYDFFHDNVGVWEEPCRPPTGYHAAVGGDQLKKQAHARSVIQKSMMMLQSRFSLKGGISDGGPYFPVAPTNASAMLAPTTVPPLVRTPSGSLKRKGPHDPAVLSGTGPSDTVFNPDHTVVPMSWKPNDLENFPYGLHVLGASTVMSENKKRKLSHENPGHQAASLPLQHRSTEELEWEDVANMFFHGGSTRNIDINYDFGSNDHLGKKKIFAPFVRTFDHSFAKTDGDAENEPSSDEDISDETVLQRHQGVLDEMKLKLDTAFETRKQHPQPRGRKR